jgi:hypothetical protein
MHEEQDGGKVSYQVIDHKQSLQTDKDNQRAFDKLPRE